MTDIDWFADDLRARLAVERALEKKQSDLAAANTEIAAHARKLTDEVIEKRKEAETLRDENTEVRHDLEVATHAVQIAERRLWESLETIPDGFAVFDYNDCLIAANNAFLAPFDGLDAVKIGASVDTIVRLALEEGLIDTGDQTPDSWMNTLADRWRNPGRDPLTLRFWNGEYVRLTERRTRDGDMVVLAIRITDNIRRERALDAARTKAEAASRAKSAFLANMSHEIRTPMNGVLAMAELLAESELTEEQRLYLDTIRNSGEALLVIINDVLDYSRIEAEKLSLHREPFDLEKSVHDVMVLLQPTAREKGLEMIVDYDMFLPTGFVGDSGRIRQVLTNLIGNAVKFTTDGHVLVRVVGLPDTADHAYRIHVVVEDTGIGIPADMRDHIFGEFNQAEDEMSRSFDGTGLGLAITQRLVGLMGGEIWVDSELGSGSSFGFSVTLPCSGEPDAPVAPLPDWLDRVAIVDASPATRDILAKQLTALGKRPEAFATVEELQADSWGENDLIFVADSARTGRDAETGGATTFVICQGPGIADSNAPGENRVIYQPFLRRELQDRLATLEAPADAAKDHPADGPPKPHRPRVLAAEDNKTNRLVLEKLLNSIDIDLTIVGNGREAVEAYRAAPPDILFTDISMPQMDGKEATRLIRAFELEEGLPRVPIVAMTAHVSHEDESDIRAAGIDHYLTKPLKRDALVAHVLGAGAGSDLAAE